MSDARSLLRAHRAANRIEHPHAAYSDAGKLLCKLCHEAVKSETLWDTHLRSAAHRQKLTALQQQQQQQRDSQQQSSSSSSSRPAAEPTESEQTTTSTNAAGVTTTTATTTINHKRKHGVDEDDMDMEDVAEAGEDVGSRKKKSRTDAGNLTPPSLTRLSSNPPGQGVEIAIPSRPATPGVNGHSPMIGSGSDSTSTPVTSAPGSFTVTTSAAAAPAPTSTSKSVDEAEWALFEAEIAVADEEAPREPTKHTSDAVISAPALTADQLAAKSQEEENERRKLQFDAELADEREDATRALEDEFDEMEELEARVRRLKEKREELRKGSLANIRATAAGQDGKGKSVVTAAKGKENGAVAEESEEDDEDEDDEEFDDGFRFRV